jgi:hypothetical protein
MSDEIAEFVRACLVEAAMTAGAAAKEGLALHVDDTTDQIDIIIYDPKEAVTRVEAIADSNAKSRMTPDGRREALYDAFARCVVGTVTISKPEEPCNGAWEVIASAARPGWGPLTYDIAMAVSPEKAIMSDRGSTSQSARAIWDFYANNRQDVVKKELDNVFDPKNEDRGDDCKLVKPTRNNVLNRSYHATSSPNVTELRLNDARARKRINDLLGRLAQGPDYDAKFYIVAAATRYFMQRYRSRT